MAIYLDSAIASEAEIARRMGWVKGITTNPTLLAKSEQPPEVTLFQLASLTSGPLFYQVTATNYEGMIAEAQAAYDLIGNQTILKIPATPVGFEVVASLSWEITCSVTGIYHPIQAAIAHEAGAKIAIAYVNRATRLLGDGIALVRDMAAILKGTDTEILAASIKSPDEAALALQAGADHLTLPLAMLQAIATHDLSEKTVAEFNQNGIGIGLKTLELTPNMDTDIDVDIDMDI